jgi:hypothetical protein
MHINVGLGTGEKDKPDVSPVPSKLCFSTRVSSGNSRLNAIKLHESAYKLKHQQVTRAELTERLGGEC